MNSFSRAGAARLRQALDPISLSGAGLASALVLALLAASGRLVAPIAVQQLLDYRRSGSAFAAVVILGTAVAVLIIATVGASILNVQLIGSSERLLHTLRTKAFDTGCRTGRTVSDIEKVSDFTRWAGPHC